MELVGEIISLLVALSPLLIQIFRLISLKIKNEKLTMVVEQATVIVNALEQSNLTNDEKKREAFSKLAIYARKKGINIDKEEIDDYIESAVKFLKLASK